MAYEYTAHTLDYPDSVSWINEDERDRMRLENTIQVADTSLFSSQASEIEYPRFMPDNHAQSMDSGIYPYDDNEDNEGISLSTVAHHISGITLSPGYASRATPTMSDYDASRPVANIDLRQAKANLSTFTYPRPTIITALKNKNFSPKRPQRSSYDKENEPPIATTPQSRTPRRRAQNVSSARKNIRLPDITGITLGASSPAKPPSPSHSDPPSQRRIVDALTRQLEAVTREAELAKGKVVQLEAELEKRRQKEQELSIDYRWSPNSRDKAALQEVTREKKALESLVESLRSHQERLEQSLQDRSYELARCKAEVLHHQETISDLRSQLSRAREEVWNRESQERSLEIQRLREEISRLEKECIYLRGCVEKGLASIIDEPPIATSSHTPAVNMTARPPVHRPPPRMAPVTEVAEQSIVRPVTQEQRSPEPATSRAGATIGDRTVKDITFVQEDEISRVQSDISERRSERSLSMQAQSPLRPASPVARPDREHEPFPRPPSRRQHARPEEVYAPSNQNEPEVNLQPRRREKARESRGTPFPQIRGEHMERLFFSDTPHDERTCSACNRKKSQSAGTPTWLRTMQRDRRAGRVGGSNGVDNRHRTEAEDRPPPQTVLIKVLRELENDFTHYKSIYCELADQYKLMDGTSNVAKRNVLAEHLIEVVRVLEKKGDQIASLYELLTYKDVPLSHSERERNTHATSAS